VSAAYRDFLAAKVPQPPSSGIEPGELHPSLFGFQQAITGWAVRHGRGAVFADTGLGKTRMQVEWARQLGERTLILAPLAVTHQTIAEASRLGVEVVYARHQGEASPGITITNYERLDRFDPHVFGAVVLDESSILKSFSGVTKKALVRAFRETPYRLCCTATPAPNDLEELCNHADFLGVMSPSEMRSTFFIADSRGEFMRYRLKRHARKAFFRWLASWALALKMPSDLGYPDDGFRLPPLEILGDFVEGDYQPEDRLFAMGMAGVGEAAAVRKATLEARVARTAALIDAEPGESWLVWCGLNDEGRALARLVPEAVVIEGTDMPEEKARRLLDFAEGRIRVLITKPTIAGFGMNFQRCARMAFLGLGYSYEQYYQAIRRCWRFGQRRPVRAHVVLSELERPVYDVVLKKEAQATDLSSGLLAEVRDYERAELFAGTSAADDYEPRQPLRLPRWLTEGAAA
jgi:superfamily II DNA or RNA helicase